MSNLIRFALALSVGFALVAPQAARADVKVATRAGYGTAGCGLGSMLIGSQPGMIQILAATLNGTGIQTFGITSGTSNCVDSEAPIVSARAFIETNREVVAKDMARGSGETIVALADLGGCKNPVHVGATLQRSYRQVFPRTQLSDRQVSANVVDVLRNDAALACTKLQ